MHRSYSHPRWSFQQFYFLKAVPIFWMFLVDTLNFCIKEAVHEGTLVCNNFLSALDTMYSKQGLNEEVAHSLLGSSWFFCSEVRDGVLQG